MQAPSPNCLSGSVTVQLQKSEYGHARQVYYDLQPYDFSDHFQGAQTELDVAGLFLPTPPMAEPEPGPEAGAGGGDDGDAEIRGFFDEVDEDGSGNIGRDEFKQLCAKLNEGMVRWLKRLHVDAWLAGVACWLRASACIAGGAFLYCRNGRPAWRSLHRASLQPPAALPLALRACLSLRLRGPSR
eukprot:SAG22_NODE_1147_length_5370_cov_3.083855_8_plen_185_part_00